MFFSSRGSGREIEIDKEKKDDKERRRKKKKKKGNALQTTDDETQYGRVGRTIGPSLSHGYPH